jgi:lipopolysaccharide transport system ATP-binding protein
MKKAEVARKFEEIVDFAEVEKFIDTTVKRYSSGMYVRLAFAVAAHLESEILIVDEVLAVGDAEFQKKCLGKMGDVSSKEGRTVLFVSHNMGAILQMCEFCLLISKGNKELLDYSSIVINKYLETKDNLTQENLLSRTDRRGNGICRVSEVYVENGQGFRNPVIKSGQALKFIFLMNKEVENYEFTFGIYDTAGIHIAGFQTKNKSEDDKLDSIINKKIICDIPELTLTPGNYSINCYLVSNGILEDHIENAYKFQVVEGDYNGRFIKSGGFAKIIMQHKWTTTFH